jgi:hypothetical protein
LAENIPYALVGAMDMQEAIDYALSGGIELESDRYLNNAVKGKKIVAAPVPVTPILTSLQNGSVDLLDGTAQSVTITEIFAPTFAGNALEGNYLVLDATGKQVGDTVDVSSLAADAKYLFTANSGQINGLGLDITAKRLYLVVDGKVAQVCRSVKGE